MNDSRDVAQNCEQDVDELNRHQNSGLAMYLIPETYKVCSATTLEEHAKRGKEDSEDDLQGGVRNLERRAKKVKAHFADV